MATKGSNTWTTQVEADGEFVRHQTNFREQVRRDRSTAYQPAIDRYHLYVSYACPWAHRTLIMRKLKGLESVISFDVVNYLLPDTGWSFVDPGDGATGDRINGFSGLREAYLQSNPSFDGAVTVPVLWDKKMGQIVNNESAEIIRMLNSEFNELAVNPQLDFYPKELRSKIDAINEWVYSTINNGVYRCGFATTQQAYNNAFKELFASLDRAEALLAEHRFLTGDRFTEADIRLFVTLLRFDAVYVGHFKTNKKRIIDYPNLWAYTRDIYQMPGIAETVNIKHIKGHYFESHLHINPHGIVPEGPELDFTLPHGRG
jgi:putative glutathione S-transferase